MNVPPFPLISLTSLFLGTMIAAAFGPVQAGEVGPMVGTVSQNEARFLYRPGEETKQLRLLVLDHAGKIVATSEASTTAEEDYVAKFHATGLAANTLYHYRIDEVTGEKAAPLKGALEKLSFQTPPAPDSKGVVTAAFVSCADETSEPVWERMRDQKVNQLFLMGDTPYIDTADLTAIRQKHRAFLQSPALAALANNTSVVGTWDDHDFGLNNGNGISFKDGKEKTRQGFIEYRAHDQYGTGNDGIYHKINLGVMEVFLLDPRWFSQTEPSPVNPAFKTCFGSQQWRWLLDSLKASTAPFKILAFGQIWQDKKNRETDDMFTYWYERDALLDFIREEAIPGVVLLGGDIHVSRHLIHPRRVGYDLHDFIISPAHKRVIPELNVPHPSLEWSLDEGRQFLTLTADTQKSPAELTARFTSHDGTVNREVVIPYDQLTPTEGEGLGRALRSWWSFEGDGKNQSALGKRLDATAANGATFSKEGGIRGGVAAFSRSREQYLLVSRSALDDNSARHSASLWCQAKSLPPHGSNERHFLLESTRSGTVGNDGAYTLSLGFRATDDPTKINLELHTYTLTPPSAIGEAPNAAGQGGFPCVVDRSLFTDQWAHIVTTFDSHKLQLYLNGKLVAEHNLPVPGPAAEIGGLVLGGHRAGTGRNYDGLLDEVALWSRVLNPGEIEELFHGGEPQALPTGLKPVTK